MSPLILILPLRLPIRLADSAPTGMSLATGLPCFVMTIPSGPTRSRSARHWALNMVAGIVFTPASYDRSEFLSSRHISASVDRLNGRRVVNSSGRRSLLVTDSRARRLVGGVERCGGGILEVRPEPPHQVGAEKVPRLAPTLALEVAPDRLEALLRLGVQAHD